jgi:hypothetical protein
LTFVDPSGEEILVCESDKSGKTCSLSLSKENQAKFLERVNYTYGCKSCASIDSKGRLQVDTSGLSKKVREATQYLTDAINADATKYSAVTIISNGNANVAFGASGTIDSGGKKLNAIFLDFKDSEALIGADELKRAFDFTTFAHEVRHQYPEATGDPTSDLGRSTGRVVDAVNNILLAQGLPSRATYYAERNEGSSPFGAIYFGSARMKDGKPQTNRDGGIAVNAESKKLLQWNKLLVGGKGIN